MKIVYKRKYFKSIEQLEKEDNKFIITHSPYKEGKIKITLSHSGVSDFLTFVDWKYAEYFNYDNRDDSNHPFFTAEKESIIKSKIDVMSSYAKLIYLEYVEAYSKENYLFKKEK